MFRKNTAGQYIHVQGVDATTGGIKSGVTWTVRRCIDGTFAAATGTATEDGSTGWYKFALSQADTDGNNIGFNFTGTGAIPQTVNIVTTACDPTSTAFGLSLAKTTNITGFNDIAATAVVSSGAITTSGGAVSTVTAVTNAVTLPTIPADWITSSGVAASAVTEIQTGLATSLEIAALNDFNPAVDVVARVTLVDTTTTNTDMRGTDGANTTAPDNAGITAIKAKTDNLPASPAATGDIPTATQNADALLNRDMAAVSDTNDRTLLNAIRFLRNLWNTTETPGFLTVKKEDDTTTAWTAALTSDPTAEPITGINPS